MHQAERQQRPRGAGRDGLIDAGLELARAGGPDAVVLRAKHPLARIGTARKSLAPAATRFGSASRSPLLNVSTERFHPDLGACAHGLTGVRFDRLAADRPFYAGKHHRHGMNLQVIAAPDGEIVGVSGPLPGAVHDLTRPGARASSAAWPPRARSRWATKAARAPATSS